MKTELENPMYESEDPILSPNALRVLERRYLARDEAGRVIETPRSLFRRVAKNIAQSERYFDIVEEKRVRVRTHDGNAYIHIGFLNGRPAEIFAHPALGKYQGFIALACRLASTILRLGGTMEQVLEQFYKAHREYGDVSTPILALMKGIQQVMAHAGHPVTVSDRCPECGSSMRMQEGCMICAVCGFSRC